MPDPREGDKKYLKGRQGVGQNSAPPLVAKAQAIQALGDTAMPTFVGSNSDHHLATALKYLGRGAEDVTRYSMERFVEEDIDRKAQAMAYARENPHTLAEDYEDHLGERMTKGQWEGYHNVRGDQLGRSMAEQMDKEHAEGGSTQELNLTYARLVAEATVRGTDASFLHPVMNHLDRKVEVLYKKDEAKREQKTQRANQDAVAVETAETLRYMKDENKGFNQLLGVVKPAKMEDATFFHIVGEKVIAAADGNTEMLEDYKDWAASQGHLAHRGIKSQIDAAIYTASERDYRDINRDRSEEARKTEEYKVASIKPFLAMVNDGKTLSEIAPEIKALEVTEPNNPAIRWYKDMVFQGLAFSQEQKEAATALVKTLPGWAERDGVLLRASINEYYGTDRIGTWLSNSYKQAFIELTTEESVIQNGLGLHASIKLDSWGQKIGTDSRVAFMTKVKDIEEFRRVSNELKEEGLPVTRPNVLKVLLRDYGGQALEGLTSEITDTDMQKFARAAYDKEIRAGGKGQTLEERQANQKKTMSGSKLTTSGMKKLARQFSSTHSSQGAPTQAILNYIHDAKSKQGFNQSRLHSVLTTGDDALTTFEALHFLGLAKGYGGATDLQEIQMAIFMEEQYDIIQRGEIMEINKQRRKQKQARDRRVVDRTGTVPLRAPRNQEEAMRDFRILNNYLKHTPADEWFKEDELQSQSFRDMTRRDAPLPGAAWKGRDPSLGHGDKPAFNWQLSGQ